MKYYKDKTLENNSYEMIQLDESTGNILKVEGLFAGKQSFYSISNDKSDKDTLKDNFYIPIKKETFKKYYKLTYKNLKLI